jgi:hypothetical protein
MERGHPGRQHAQRAHVFALRAQAGRDARAPNGCRLVLVFAFSEDLLGGEGRQSEFSVNP